MIATGTNIIHPSFSTASLYVGDLNEDVTEAVLYEIFNTVGHVSSIRVCRDSVTRKSLGYAYVNYHNLTDAERALDTLNYTNIKGQPARIMWSHRDPSLRKSGAGNVFVKNLDKSIDNKALFDAFSMFGNILSCKVATDEFGKSKSYGFVHYEDEESAKEAIEKVNGATLGSKPVYVGHFIKKLERATVDNKYTNLYVKNFPHNITENDLKKLFSPFGEITSMIMRTDARNRKFCFVNYASFDSAKNAVESLNGKRILENGQIDTTYDSSNVKREDNESTESGTNNEKEQGHERNAETTAEGVKVDAKSKKETTSSTSAAEGTEGKERLESKEKKEGTEQKEEKDSEAKGGNASSETVYILYVVPHQSRARRHALLKAKFENINAENKNKHQGVNLYIKNLDDEIDDGMLRELFEPFGTITSAKVMKNDKEQSKGFGFVCFASPENASKAVTEMHLKIVNGKPLYVGLAEKREQRQSRLQQRFRLQPLRHHMNNSINSAPIQYASPQSTQMQFNQNALNYGRPVMAPFNQNNMVPWRNQQVAPQQIVTAAAVAQQQQQQQQMNFSNNMRGHINPMRLYSQNNMHQNNMHQNGMMNNSMHTNKNNQFGNNMNQHMNQNQPGQGPNQQAVGMGGAGAQGQGMNQPNGMAPGNQMMNNMRNMNNRSGRNHMQNMNMGNAQKQMPLNAVSNKNNQQSPMQQPGAGVGGMNAGTMGNSNTQQNQMNQTNQANQANNFKFTPQARNRMEVSNKNMNKMNNMNYNNVANLNVNTAPNMNNNTNNMGVNVNSTNGNNPAVLTAATLAVAPPAMQKHLLGEYLYPLVANYHPTLAGKITGMMLEMDNSELLILLENEEELKKKIDEAMIVLQQAK